MRKSLTIIGKVQKGTKSYYDILVENKSKPKWCIKWNSVLSNSINWPTTFYKIWKIHEIKLKWFQICLVHRIFAINITLKRMKVTNNEKCTFCNKHNESIPHLFWSCNIVQHFWFMFETFVNEKSINMINMKLTEDFFIFRLSTQRAPWCNSKFMQRWWIFSQGHVTLQMIFISSLTAVNLICPVLCLVLMLASSHYILVCLMWFLYWHYSDWPEVTVRLIGH